MNAAEAYSQIFQALEYLSRDSRESDQLINWLYTPHPKISDYLSELAIFLEKDEVTREQKQHTGYLLEQILCLSFMGLSGYSEIKSYQSATHQYDLLISGDGTTWDMICDRLYLRDPQQTQIYRGILCEAKAIDSPVSSSTFARLCHIVSTELSNTVGLGVLVVPVK